MTRDELEKILENHKKWLTGNGGKRAYLVGVDLQDADLSNADLQEADLRKAYLSGADLSNADLSNANLQEADLSKANLQEANLQEADLSKANLNNANLRNADLDYSCLPLWCGSVGMIVDDRIRKQLLYHAVVLLEKEQVKKFITDEGLEFINEFHRVLDGSVGTITM